MKKQSGFTLIEVMISMAIFAGTVGAFAGYYATSSRLNESNRNLTRAMTDARTVLEEIRNTVQSNGLAAVTATDWTAWAATSANGIVNPAAGQPGLDNEAVRVFYVAPPAPAPPAAPGAAPAGPPDPLNVTVRVEWTERNRARWIDVDTILTRRL